MDETIQLLKQFTESNRVPGYESPIRKHNQSYPQPFGPNINNKLSNLICINEGKLGL